MELLPFVDILKVFNNPINEEQAWAVCYQCLHFLFHHQNQEYYQVVFDYGIHSVWLSRQGDVLLRKRPPDPNGSGKGPPQQHQNSPHSPSISTTVLSKRKGHVIATETDAVQALGTAIFEALDYGIDASEERQLSQGLESLIVTMTNADNSLESDPDALNADDEGIEKDADMDHRCTVQDVIKMCTQHLSSKQDAQHHYKAVCRALATEAGELFTFLEKITSCKEKLSQARDEDTMRLEELQRTDWVMRSLRQGVQLKKVANVTLPPVEYELTPFEILLEDIRSRRYTLHKIMVDGDIPHMVKDNAHAVILDFIRSRPPLKKVHERKLKPKPPPAPDPHERLLKEIRSRPKLRPIRDGILVVATSGCRLNIDDELDAPRPVKRVIKPDLHLLLNSSFEESSEEEDRLGESSPASSSPLSTVNGQMIPPLSSWHRSGEAYMQDVSGHRPTRLQRRHTIMVCESSLDRQVTPQELPPLEEEEEPSPVRENHHFSHHSVSKPTVHSLTALSRTSYSDNDLSNQVTLRNPQGHTKRSSLEHRRSLTSLTTELCAIPEMEDGAGGTDSPTKSPGTLLRSWSHEQAPPPNPSPPCKGRARAVLGMSMKSVGGAHHPVATHRLPTSPSATLTFQNLSTNQSTSSDTTVDSPQTTLPACHSQPVLNFPSKHVPVSTSTSSSLQPSSSLDPTTSSQSPGYSRKAWKSQNPTVKNGDSSVSHVDSEHHAERWRYHAERRDRLNNRKQLHGNSIDNILDDNILLAERQHSVVFPKDDIPSRRLSLDSGVGVYNDGSSVGTETSGFDRLNKGSRRSSVGTQRRGRGADVTARRVRSPEEEERLSRWRVLQEEDLTSRTRKVGRDMTSRQQCVFSGESTHQQHLHHFKGPSLPAQHVPQHHYQQHHYQQHHYQQQHFQQHTHQKVPLQPARTIDVLQQKVADEEARFARWRHLEETGRLGIHPDESSSWMLTADGEYVSDNILPARLQCAAPTNSVATASTILSMHDVLPLPKRWQNPVECLSLTLEEVTHIRTVLTKAELESLISHPDLYQQVYKSKLCFTCKTTRFTMFGEWGTRCKFCKRTVCSKCLRKMSVPSDQFQEIPVYMLSSPPLTPEMMECVQNFIKTASTTSVQHSPAASPNRNRTAVSDQAQKPQEQTSQPPEVTTSSLELDLKNSKGFLSRSKPLQRSQSLFVPSHKQGSETPRTVKGPSMAICCDCKGMLKEIIRATQSSLAMLSSMASHSTACSGSNVHHVPSMSTKLTRN